ncbi:proline racemase family protein [Rhodococcus sp. IEGM 248]|uniref:proline racemase family protein n=1 Tax=Rhodococcus opacus TaxID=37919 RepID=UPI0013C20E28|nr:proline racemase family protein [Rhodococcus opacus]MDV7082672.1 proline racemase family protein [Rhodococcus opacus]NDV03754.1 proline racemase family protein [Rhodococcus sp. IEGM 248]
MRWSRVVNVVKCHVGGEINNVVTGGIGDVPGATVFDKMKYFREHRDDLRQLLLHEPRGSVTQCVNFVVPATDPEAQMGYVIAESTEYPAMSGSNTMCVATALLETGMIPMVEPVTDIVLEAPAGLIRIRCTCENGKVTSVEFENQPAFAYEIGVPLELDGHGTLTVDVAWGGMAYVLADADQLGLKLQPDEARDICDLGQKLKTAAAEQIPAVHPTNPEFAGITQTEFVGPLSRTDGVLTARNAVVVSPGRLDRSPCGTGTSARLAVLKAKGLIEVGEKFVHESVIGSRFESRIDRLTKVGTYDAVVPRVSGQAYITELSQVGLDPADPFPTGYTLSDTWPTGN